MRTKFEIEDDLRNANQEVSKLQAELQSVMNVDDSLIDEFATTLQVGQYIQHDIQFGKVIDWEVNKREPNCNAHININVEDGFFVNFYKHTVYASRMLNDITYQVRDGEIIDDVKIIDFATFERVKQIVNDIFEKAIEYEKLIS